MKEYSEFQIFSVPIKLTQTEIQRIMKNTKYSEIFGSYQINTERNPQNYANHTLP